MMGETFKYVAPVAGALKFSVEDCAVAIGLMANSGIKASQAGTSMRQLFTNLVKPTDAMAQAMEDLGISMTDAEGKTKSLDALMGDLRQSFSGLSEAQKAQYAATLAGQEGMSGLLAIVNASDADFNALKTSIYNADGAAEQMADTMNDNLKGSLTIAGSALEGFGIAIYEKIQTPLKKAVDAGTEDINRLSKAFQSGGLNAVVAEAGEIFNDTADEIAGMSDEAAGVVRPGSMFGARYAAGVGAKASEAGAKGRALASNAKSGAESADGYSPGSNFGSGFVRGIGSWVRSAASAAAELASAAYNAVRRTLDEHSPSRKTKKSGKNFDLGLGGGIEDNADVAVQAAEKLSERTLSALDLETLQNKIKMLNIPETMATIQTTVNSQANRSAEKAIRAVKIKEDQLWKRNNESVKTYLQDSDIQKLASEFAGIASEEFARNIDGMKMVMDRRECGRFVREVQQ